MDTTHHVDAKELCIRQVQSMADGALEDFEAIVHPDARNREDVDEPPASRGRGPAAFYATALWMRDAYADLRWDIHDAVAEGDLVVLHATMSGRHTGAFVGYDADARPAQAFPPTGRRFATTQTHWFRIADGKVIEHWANRDDLGTAVQLGWTPPSPLYMIRMFLATRRAAGRPHDDHRAERRSLGVRVSSGSTKRAPSNNSDPRHPVRGPGRRAHRESFLEHAILPRTLPTTPQGEASRGGFPHYYSPLLPRIRVKPGFGMTGFAIPCSASRWRSRRR